MDAGQAGWPIQQWCADVGISRPAFYTIPAEAKPASVKIGSKTLITESPAAWLERMREAGGVKLMRPKRNAGQPATGAA
jgi:hypothetical protein